MRHHPIRWQHIRRDYTTAVTDDICSMFVSMSMFVVPLPQASRFLYFDLHDNLLRICVLVLVRHSHDGIVPGSYTRVLSRP